MHILKKRTFLFAVLIILALFAVSSVFANPEQKDNTETIKNRLSALNCRASNGSNCANTYSSPKINAMLNGTFGQCVSQATKDRNICYKEQKQFYKDCKENAKIEKAINKTNSKNISKLCKDSYSIEMKNCKSDFKSVKAQCKELKARKGK